MEPASEARRPSGRSTIAPGLERSPASLVGRGAELGVLRDAIDAGRAVVVTGEPGIGKSALLTAAVAGRPVRMGGALGMLASLPYLAFRRAFGTIADGEAAAVARDVARRMPVGGVLVLDDLHWADDATLAAIPRLVGRVPVLAGAREGDERAEAAIAALETAGFRRVRLRPLDVPDAAALALRMRPSLGPAAARRVATHAGGNPLLVEELARAGATTSLRLGLDHRLRRLDASTRSLAELLAIAGAPLPISVLRADPDRLARLVAAGFASSDGKEVEIRHALIAEVIAAGLTPEQRVERHRRAAALVDEPMLRARHLAATGDRAGAARVATEAARTSPAGVRASLLALAAEHATGPAAAELRLDAAEALADAAWFREAERLLDLVPPADTAARPTGAAGARALGVRARVRWGVGDGPGSLEAAEAAVSVVAGSGTVLEARLRLERAWTVTLMRDGPRAVRFAREALAAHEATGLPTGPARRVLATALSITQVPMAEWGPLLEAAAAEARARGDLAEELLCGKILVPSQEVAGDPAAGRRLGQALVARAREAGMLGWEQSIRASLVSLALSQGEYDRAIAEADGLLDEPLEPRARSQVAGYFALALVDRGRHEDARRVIDGALALAPDDPDGRFDLLLAQVEHALVGGDPSRALALAEACLVRHGEAAYGDVRHLRVSRDWAAFELGRAPGPPVPDDRVHPYWSGAALEREGIRLLAAGLPAEAADSFAAATRRYAPYLRRAELRSRWAHGASLRRGGRAAEAITVLEAAEADARALGMAPLEGRIRRSLRLAGARRSTPRGRSGRLSAREAEVLDLVAAGLTNAQIATRLGIGRPTVVRLVANANDKLGTSSRLQAALHAGDTA